MTMTPESLLSIAAGLALAAAAGFRVFVPLLVVSIAARSGWLEISPAFDWISTTQALIVFATATVVEIGAYYVPFLDNLLDAISTPAAVLAGMIASASVLVDLPPWLQYPIAIVGAGGTAARPAHRARGGYRDFRIGDSQAWPTFRPPADPDGLKVR